MRVETGTSGWWDARAEGVLLRIRVVPRASRTAVSGVQGDALKIRLQAPPVDGAANEALVSFLAEALDIKRNAITLERGQASRNKAVLIRGSADAIRPDRLLE